MCTKLHGPPVVNFEFENRIQKIVLNDLLSPDAIQEMNVGSCTVGLDTNYTCDRSARNFIYSHVKSVVEFGKTIEKVLTAPPANVRGPKLNENYKSERKNNFVEQSTRNFIYCILMLKLSCEKSIEKVLTAPKAAVR